MIVIDDPLHKYSEKTALFWLLQAAHALQYMHEYKIERHVHGDIKPLNMLLDKEYRILKLCDFGTTAKIKENEITMMCGTDYYMAPEVFDGKYSEKSDNYSWAISVEHCLIREVPFSSCRNDVCLVICKNSDFYQSENTNVSLKIKKLIKKCTYINPLLRLKMVDIVTILDEYLINDLRVQTHSCKLAIILKILEYFMILIMFF